MSHEIQEYDLAIYAQKPWHNRGVVLGDLLTVDDINRLVQPFWPIIAHRDNWAYDNRGVLTPGVGRQVWNTTSNTPLQAVSNRHAIMPYTVLGDTAIRLMESGLAEGVESAGTLQNGRKAYITLRTSEIKIEGYSRVYTLFSLTDVVDGSGAAAGGGVLNVIVCLNTFKAYRLSKSFGKAWSIPHRGEMELSWDAAVTAFTEHQLQAKEISQAIEQLINETYKEADWNGLVRQLAGPIPESKIGRTLRRKRIDGLHARYMGDDIAPLRETKWGALMAVQGYEQHESPARGDRSVRHDDRVMFGREPMTDKAMNILVGA